MPGGARVPQLVPASWWRGGAGGDMGVHWGAALQLYEGACPSPSLPQVGCFDPYSDDPRLGVQKIALCKYTAKMVVAGTAGQVGQQGTEPGLPGTSWLPHQGHVAGRGLQTLKTPTSVHEGLLLSEFCPWLAAGWLSQGAGMHPPPSALLPYRCW